eukprot:1919599-Amphidinium_carterae.1
MLMLSGAWPNACPEKLGGENECTKRSGAKINASKRSGVEMNASKKVGGGNERLFFCHVRSSIMDQFVLRKTKTSSNTDESGWVWILTLHRSEKKRVARPNHQTLWEDLIKSALTSHKFEVVGQLKQKEVPTWWRPTMGLMLEPPEHALAAASSSLTEVLDSDDAVEVADDDGADAGEPTKKKKKKKKRKKKKKKKKKKRRRRKCVCLCQSMHRSGSSGGAST